MPTLVDLSAADVLVKWLPWQHGHNLVVVQENSISMKPYNNKGHGMVHVITCTGYCRPCI